LESRIEAKYLRYTSAINAEWVAGGAANAHEIQEVVSKDLMGVVTGTEGEQRNHMLYGGGVERPAEQIGISGIVGAIEANYIHGALTACINHNHVNLVPGGYSNSSILGDGIRSKPPRRRGTRDKGVPKHDITGRGDNSDIRVFATSQIQRYTGGGSDNKARAEWRERVRLNKTRFNCTRDGRHVEFWLKGNNIVVHTAKRCGSRSILNHFSEISGKLVVVGNLVGWTDNDVVGCRLEEVRGRKEPGSKDKIKHRHTHPIDP